jgi:3-hydroxyisobutyrate dehydrogenase-like beta-hydroxyacid dehydrogenase
MGERKAEQRIGFIGLGRMGEAMAGRLLAAGHAVTVFNRTASKARPLEVQGARVAASVAEAARADVVITMLADDSAVERVALDRDGLVASLAEGAVHVSMSTIGISLADRLSAAHAAAGQRFVSAPVFGRPDAAAAARLYILTAGAPDAVAECLPLFEAMGQRVFPMGDVPRTANLVKLATNFLIMSVIESVGEAMALVGKQGVDRADYLEFLTSTLFDAPVYRTYGGLVAGGDFTNVGFAAPLGLKDVRLALAAGDELRVPMPLASLLRDRFLTLLAMGGEGLDWAAIGALAARDSGQPGPLG